MFDVLVIGKGLMGCGAVRHLTVAHPELNVGIIGPDEPEDRKVHGGVFASHYDEARITRVLDASPIWATLAKRSIDQYPVIEQASGVTFHYRRGCLRATDSPGAIAGVEAVAARFHPPYERLGPEQLRERYPFLSAGGSHFTAFDEKGEAGYINPRRLVQAQLAAAAAKDATIIRETVSSMNVLSDHVEFKTDAGAALRARRVLITAGGFTNLLVGRKLAIRTLAHTILLAEVGNDEIARLRAMPSIVTRFDDPSVPSVYMLPPVRYPDGKTYVKLGPAFRPSDPASRESYIDSASHAALRDWFHSDGRADIAQHLREALHQLLPHLKVESYVSQPCLMTFTTHENPYVDTLIPGKVYVATGGNGSAAKSSDEIGRIGAIMAATDRWDSELNREDFRASFA
jgi:sarcosine oxidase